MKGWKRNPDNQRAVVAVTLVEDVAAAGKRRGLIGTIVSLMAKIASATSASGDSGVELSQSTQFPRASRAAEAVLEGTSSDNSLEAEIAVAHIADEYEVARAVNRNLGAINEQVALERLEAVVSLCAAIGVEVKPARLADGSAAIVLGPGLVEHDQSVRANTLSQPSQSTEQGDAST